MADTDIPLHADAGGWRKAYIVCNPVDPGPRDTETRTGRTMPAPGAGDIVRPCQGCGTRIWIEADTVRSVTARDLAAVCRSCHRGHLISKGWPVPPLPDGAP